jgi:acyl-CoA synthetase (AMP-forming)/AMP-acid ligase II
MVAPAMILGDPQAAHVLAGEPATLDDLFRQAAARRPDAMALCDPPNRLTFTDGGPRHLTYAQADHIVSAIAGRLRRLGLSTDAAVGLQLPNTVESTLALLGVLRAGMIAVPLPLLWRRIDAAAALNRVGARAIITGSRIGAADYCNIARDVAAVTVAVDRVASIEMIQATDSRHRSQSPRRARVTISMLRQISPGSSIRSPRSTIPMTSRFAAPDRSHRATMNIRVRPRVLLKTSRKLSTDVRGTAIDRSDRSRITPSRPRQVQHRRPAITNRKRSIIIRPRESSLDAPVAVRTGGSRD